MYSLILMLKSADYRGAFQLVILLPFFGLIGILTVDARTAETAETRILQCGSFNLVLFPDLPPQEQTSKAGRHATDQDIQPTRFANSFSCFPSAAGQAAACKAASSRFLTARAEAVFPLVGSTGWFLIGLWSRLSCIILRIHC